MNSPPPLSRQLNDQSGMPMIELHSPHGRALVCLQGAQVVEYQPTDQPEVIWLSNKSLFQAGKAIRGGIPICWPWFGDHPNDPALPAHGLVRTRLWTVLERTDNGETASLKLGLKDDENSRQQWPYKFQLELLIQLNHRLTLTLSSHNPNEIAMPISEALHSYFSVSNIEKVRTEGLKGSRYRDKLNSLQQSIQHSPLIITSEVDRVYVDTDARITITDPILKRQILIDKTHSHSTVIWNPGRQKSQAMKDMDDEGYETMLCVETANVLKNSLLIPPAESHHISTTIESVSLDQADTA